MIEKVSRRWQYRPWTGLVFLSVGLLLLGWLLNTPGGLLGKADAVGYAVCHRIELRSFQIGDRQVPLCARCTGMYLGAMLALVYQVMVAPRRMGMPPWSVILFLGALVGVFALDGLNSYLHFFPGAPTLYEPHNTLRLITGTGMGLAIAVALFPAFNQTIWKDWDWRPALAGLRSLGVLLVLAILLVLLVLTENPLILYPLALVSAAGVLVLLTIVYAIVLLMILRSENRFTRLGELVLPLAGGFFIALLQIGLIDLIRYWLTGTWDGFHLG